MKTQSASKRNKKPRQRFLEKMDKLASQGEAGFQSEGVAESWPKETGNPYIEKANIGSDHKEYVKLKSNTIFYLGNTRELKYTRMPYRGASHPNLQVQGHVPENLENYSMMRNAFNVHYVNALPLLSMVGFDVSHNFKRLIGW